MFSTEVIIGIVGVIGTPVVGALGWATKKLIDHDQKIALYGQGFDDLKELITTRFDSSDQRIGRIERSLNGHLHRD